ncbi:MULTISPECIES: hypothetical protein [Enterobacter]|uniref:hypothetical protein n=1 Tax=Enterobacter hormaechei TaxID=158836 RepID=UPI00201168C7|nr:hypothetical protein [Enterobacter hormaechei]
MTQLIASYELAIGCESTATSSLLPGQAPGFFLGVHHAFKPHELAHRRTYGAGRFHLISSRTGRCAMAAFNVGAIVQKKTGGINGVVDCLQEPDGDHPQFWVRWDDRNYSVHPENELRAATIDGPRLYKEMA